MAKKTIVILHGWQSKLFRWKKLENLLRKDFKVYLPSQPGFGSRRLARPWNIDDYCDWLQKYFKKNHLTKPILLGHSNGGRLALEYLSQGNKADSLILMACAGVKSKKTFKRSIFKILAKTGKFFFSLPILNQLFEKARWFLYTLAREKDYFLAEGNMRKTFLNLISQDELINARKIKLPTLLLWGAKDRITPVADAWQFNKAIKNSRLIIFKNAGHNLHCEKPKSVYQQVRSFCQ